MLHNEVINFSLNIVSERLRSDPQRVCNDLESFARQDLTLSEANIDLDRKSLYHWKKHGLLPLSGTPKTRGKNKTWGRFSFIELCWLKMLIELRTIGIGLDKLQKIKSLFFPENFIEMFFSGHTVNVDILDPEIQRTIHKNGLIKDGRVQVTPEFYEPLQQLQFSLFSCMIYSATLTRGNLVFWGNGKDQYDLIDLNKITKDPIKGIMDFHKILSNETVFFVNIKKIIADLSNTHDHFSKELRLSQMISDDSVTILRDLFRDDAVREVTIRVNDKGRHTAWVRREMKIDELENELRGLQKKGTYCDLVIKTRDGNVQYFEHTEIIKL